MKSKSLLLALLALSWTRLSWAGEPANAHKPLVAAVDAIGITVSDMDRSRAFYRDVLTFEKHSDEVLESQEVAENYGLKRGRVRRVRLKLGDESIVLTQFLEPKGRPIPVDSRSNDRWFQHIAVITGDMDRAYQRLLEHKVTGISPAPQRLPDWNRAAGGIRAYYFRDPDGHPLEILQFPQGKGQRKWQQSSERLFLGVDHTAIVVADTARSLELYRDLLGMKIVGESMNSGPEQERLNDVPGARLRITSLRTASGPGVELLEYLYPTDGRESATDTNAADLVHWQTIMSTASLPEAVAKLSASKANVPLRSSQGASLFDPDRHVVRIQPANGIHSDLRGGNP